MSDRNAPCSDPSAGQRAVERRARPRHACELKVQWRPLGSPDDALRQGSIKDLSNHGLCLISHATLRRGTLVVLNLEGVGQRSSLCHLARVVHASGLNDNEWLIGCSLVSKLHDTEVAALLQGRPVGQVRARAENTTASTAASARSHERRAAPRQQTGPTALEVCNALASLTPEQGWLVDRSQGGLCLSVGRAYQEGSKLKVRPFRSADSVRWLLLKVRNHRRQGNRWLLGCEFVVAPSSNQLLQLG